MRKPTVFRVLALFVCMILIAQAVPAAKAAPAVQADSAVRVVESSAQRLVLELSLPAYQLTPAASDRGPCSQISLPGWGSLGQPGEPSVPMTGVMIGIPAGGSARIVQVSPSQEQVLEGFELCPTPTGIQEYLPSGEVVDAGWQLLTSAAAYQSGAPFPGAWAELGDTGFIRSQRVQQVRLQPFQYNPAAGTLRIAQRVRVEIAFEGAAGAQSAVTVDEGAFEHNLQAALVNYQMARAWRSQPAQAAADPAAVQPAAAQPAYKLAVTQDGFTRATYDALLTAGVPVASIDPATFQLTSQGSPVAISVVDADDSDTFNSGDYLLFYGQKLNTRYTDKNIYWLTWGAAPGTRMASADGTPAAGSTPAAFRAVVRREVNLVYSPIFSSNLDNDHWFWELLHSSLISTTPKYKDYTIQLTGVQLPSDATARVRGALIGYAASPQHFTQVSINGHQVVSSAWPAKGELNFEADIPQSDLLEGANTIRITLPMHDGTNPITLDAFYLNWLEVEYDKKYHTNGGQFVFSGDATGNWNYKVTGFDTTDALLFDITNPLLPVQINGGVFAYDAGSDSQMLSFQQTISAKRQYAAVPPASISTISSGDIVNSQSADLHNPANSADYLIITHPDFMAEANRLADYRAGEGLQVMVVDVIDVYDEFSFGLFDPEALRSFTTYAYENWATAPQYLLLFGDGNYDFKQVLKPEKNYIPPYLMDVDPWLGEISADNRYAAVSGADILPDMAVGRLPVQDGAKATAVIDKILAYKASTAGGWTNAVTFAAGNFDPASADFAGLSDALIAAYGANFASIEKVYYGVTHTQPGPARDAVEAAFNAGRGIIHYAGHSAAVAWQGDVANPNGSHMLNTDSISRLTNQTKLPFLVSMTCLTGNYNNPHISALDEQLLLKADGGIIAGFSPTGKGLPDGHDAMDYGLFNALFLQKITDLGSATNLAKYYLAAQAAGNFDLIDSHTYLGDPALRYPTTPTPVALKYFVAQKTGTSVEVLWSLQSEISTHGYNLYRRSVPGSFVKLNTDPIPAVFSGQVQANPYRFIDPLNPAPGAAYEYKLEVIENSLMVSSNFLARMLYYSYNLPFIKR